MKCPTEGCMENLPVHARKKYCKNCRSTMARWAPGAKKRNGEIVKPSDIMEAIASRTRSIFRLTHFKERKDDIMDLRRRPRRATR